MDKATAAIVSALERQRRAAMFPGGPGTRRKDDRATMKSVVRAERRRAEGRWPGIGDPAAVRSIQAERARQTPILAEAVEQRLQEAMETPPKRIRAELTPEQRERKREADRIRRAKQKEAA